MTGMTIVARAWGIHVNALGLAGTVKSKCNRTPAVDHFTGVGEPEPDAEPEVPASSLNSKKKQKFIGSAVSTPIASSPYT
ncbi:hypothetical protein E1B28_001611 [Marasmius oreades]|uniref:Uncharacterized protein n=1 Tax=Marasmius oreades TaxID=181124 RepID=A0A9P7V3Y3_9AGAR|nr:uncharacterized protein E1B28_001611 [Marasmius oreades]KAG7099799.1 hypothetical protein E1B28_001611 [Marasmius oreades]